MRILKKYFQGFTAYEMNINSEEIKGCLFIRKFIRTTFMATVYIGKRNIGVLSLKKAGIYFNSIKISEWSKIDCTNTTITRNMRKALEAYFERPEVQSKKRANKKLIKIKEGIIRIKRSGNHHTNPSIMAEFINLKKEAIALHRITVGVY